jgi:hypothetical protein
MTTNDAMETESKKVYASSLTQALNAHRTYILENAPQTDETKDFLGQFLDKDTTTQFLERLTQNFHRHNEEELESDLELFYQFFCSSDLDQRLHYLYNSDHDLKQKFQMLQQHFGQLHIDCVRSDLCDLESEEGKETDRKLVLISFCIKTSFDKLVLEKMLEHAQDPDMQQMLQELSPKTMFQELDMSKLEKHQQLIHFYLRKANRNQYRKLGDKLYKPKFNAQKQFVYCYEYVCTISEFVFKAIYPLEQNQYWFNCLTKKPSTLNYVIEILTKSHTEWLPNLKVNNNIAVFQNGIFYSVNKQLYGFESIRDLMLLENNIITLEYHDFPLNLRK